MNRYGGEIKRCARCGRWLGLAAFAVDGFVREVCADCRKEAARNVKSNTARWGVPKQKGTEK